MRGLSLTAVLTGALVGAATLGCVTPRAGGTQPAATAAATVIPEPRLPPSSLEATINVSQRLRFSHRDDPGAPRSLEALLEVDAQSVRLAGFAMQHRVFTLLWDGTELTEQRAPQVPRQLVAAEVLRDLQLAYWPAAALRAVLPAGWALEDTQDGRVLTEAGAERVRIGYDAEPRWSGRTTIDNLPGRYQLVIDSAPDGE